MDQILLSALLLFDVVILFLIVKKFKKIDSTSNKFDSSSQEQRLVMDEMSRKVEQELRAIHADAKKMLVELQKVATFKEIEVRRQKETLEGEMESLSSEFKGSIEQILHQLDSQHDKLLSARKLTEESVQSCLKATSQAEVLVQGLEAKLPLQEVIDKLEKKKFEQARHLLTRGKTPEEIASKTGLHLRQIDMLFSAN